MRKHNPFAAAFLDPGARLDDILVCAAERNLIIVEEIHTQAALIIGAQRKAWGTVLAASPEIFVCEGWDGMKAIQRLHHNDIAVLFASTPPDVSDYDAALDAMTAAMRRWYEGRGKRSDHTALCDRNEQDL